MKKHFNKNKQAHIIQQSRAKFNSSVSVAWVGNNFIIHQLADSLKIAPFYKR
jgi:hypothetical protein